MSGFTVSTGPTIAEKAAAEAKAAEEAGLDQDSVIALRKVPGSFEVFDHCSHVSLLHPPPDTPHTPTPHHTHCTHYHTPHTPPHTRHVTCSTAVPVLIDADWCLQSDLMPDSRLFPGQAGRDERRRSGSAQSRARDGVLDEAPQGRQSR